MMNPFDPTLPLSTAEWDFSSVPEHELEACLLWELGREYQDLERDIFAAIEEASDHCAKYSEAWYERFEDCANINEASMFYRMFGVPSPSGFHENCPWQDYGVKTRDSISQCVNPGILHLLNLDDVSKSDIGSRRVAAFQVNWKETDGRLLNDFSLWLRKHRKHEPVERRGSNPRDHLKMLGAMRLLHHFSFDQAFDLTRTALGSPLYGRRPSWERARKGALEVFRTRLFVDWGRFVEHPVPISFPKLVRSKKIKP